MVIPDRTASDLCLCQKHSVFQQLDLAMPISHLSDFLRSASAISSVIVTIRLLSVEKK